MWRFWQKHGHLAEARRRLEAMEAAPWSNDDPRLRAQLLEALGGTLWWQGEIAEMGQRYEEALALWQSIGDEHEIANAYYNASFQLRGPARRRRPGRPDDGRRTTSASPTSRRRATSTTGSAIGAGEANALWGLGNYHYFQSRPGDGVEQFRRDAGASSASVGDRTMEAWSLHMLGTSAAAQRRCSTEAREQRSTTRSAIS